MEKVAQLSRFLGETGYCLPTCSVDQAAWRGIEVGMGILCQLADDALPGFAATPGTVRGDDQAWNIAGQQWVVGLRWFAAEHITGGAAQMAAAQGIGVARLRQRAHPPPGAPGQR